ncbi:MAG: ribbon-helix-helix protein, CopG family [Candidatus Bathyarchaeota archaeon]|nr:ribbon-helix-helix protein, CopG family [Candidatus Bathyarchaeota archaeon]
MDEIITSRFNEELVKKMDEAVARGHFRSRSEALRVMVEEYLKTHPDLFIGDGLKRLAAEAPTLPDRKLEEIGRHLFKDEIATLVAEGRERR